MPRHSKCQERAGDARLITNGLIWHRQSGDPGLIHFTIDGFVQPAQSVNLRIVRPSTEANLAFSHGGTVEISTSASVGWMDCSQVDVLGWWRLQMVAPSLRACVSRRDMSQRTFARVPGGTSSSSLSSLLLLSPRDTSRIPVYFIARCHPSLEESGCGPGSRKPETRYVTCSRCVNNPQSPSLCATCTR